MNIYDIWLAKLEIKNEIKLKLLYENDSKELFFKSSEYFKELLGEKYIKTINRICSSIYKENLEKYYYLMKSNSIELINYKDINYPSKLKYIVNKPAFLFYKGNINIIDNDSVAIVGSRNPTELGKNLSRKFAYELANKNINIVSGLANGIDKYAHLGALDSDIGKTIAVLGTGLGNEDIYPYENKKVFERIIDSNGLIVSEYIIGTKPISYHFPLRNRIISGLSNKLIVIEAKEKSGSLITVNYALEQGKDVFVVPRKVK